jgi:hypothetical protein
VLWQREPVPGARPAGEAQVSAPAQRSEAPAAPASPPPAAPSPSPAPSPQAPERALPSSQDIVGGAAPVPEAPAESATAPAPAPAPAKGARSSRSAERPAPTPAPSELARRQADDAALSGSAAATAKEARKKEAAAPAAEPAPAAAPPAAAPPPPSASPALPTFSALSQWSRITITQRGGASRTLSRAEAQDLNALLGSAAISAIGSQPLAGTPEWRVTLERSNGDVMATFELGRNQVRWREGRGAAATGMPSASSLAALREALQHAVEPPAQPSSPPQWRFKPQPPAEPEPAPAAPSR